MKNNAIAQARKVISYRTICFFSSPPQSSTRIRSGGGRRWSTCIKRWNVATLSPRRRGDTARLIQGDRKKPRERRRNPRNRRGGVGEHPLSPPPEGAAEAANDGARASSGGTSPRSPPGEGETPRGLPKATGGSPVGDAATRKIGGAESGNVPSVHHPKAQRRRQAMEHVHQAVERRHALRQAKGRHRAANQHATRGIGGAVAGMNENALTAGHMHQARQSRLPGRRPPTGRAGKAWRNHIEPERIFAGGDGRMRPRRRRFERSDGRLSALGGKKQYPLGAPGQVGGAAQKNQCRHLEKE